MSGIQETFEALDHFFIQGVSGQLLMKEYRTNEELIDYLSSKGVIVALKIMGFPVNNNQEDEYNKNERYLENF